MQSFGTQCRLLRKELRRRKHKLKQYLKPFFSPTGVLHCVMSYLVPPFYLSGKVNDPQHIHLVLFMIEHLHDCGPVKIQMPCGFVLSTVGNQNYDLYSPDYGAHWNCSARDLLHMYLGINDVHRNPAFQEDLIACNRRFREFIDRSIFRRSNCCSFAEEKGRFQTGCCSVTAGKVGRWKQCLSVYQESKNNPDLKKEILQQMSQQAYDTWENDVDIDILLIIFRHYVSPSFLIFFWFANRQYFEKIGLLCPNYDYVA